MNEEQPESRVTAYRYAVHHGLPCTLEYLAELGRQAARRARWLGLESRQVPEGPFLVHAWPERIWEEVAGARRAEYSRGAYAPSPSPSPLPARKETPC